jgi:hypothetical protein
MRHLAPAGSAAAKATAEKFQRRESEEFNPWEAGGRTMPNLLAL